jgi:integrase
LIQIDPSKLKDEKPGPPLEVFAAAAGLEDFPVEDQLAAYVEQYGPASPRRSARARIIAKQLDALQWLETLIAQAPQAGDQVTDWLAPALASRLQMVGIPTLFALAERINERGAAWHIGIPGIGAGKAARILEWMDANQETTMLAIGKHVRFKRFHLPKGEDAELVPLSTAVRPLEKFLVPAKLDGSEGKYREPAERCQLMASNDYEAIHAWLASKRARVDGSLSPTQRAYRKEGERLLLWAVLERNKPMSSLTIEDATAYLRFLENPPAAWCGPRHHERGSPLWRPLEGPLQAAARAQAHTILRSLYVWLNEQGYLHANPFAGVTRASVSKRAPGSGRTLTQKQIAYALDRLKAMPDTAPNRRLQLVVPWLYFTGLRLAEIIAARCGHLESESVDVDGSATTAWIQTVIGKGERVREVPVPAGLVDLLSDQLEAAGRPRDPRAPENEGTPLVIRCDDGAQDEHGNLLPLSATVLYKTLRRFFMATAAQLAKTDPVSAVKLSQASTHWLRHSHTSHAVNGGPGRVPVPVHIAQGNLGHASLNTTTGYIKTELNERVAAMQGFFKLAG